MAGEQLPDDPGAERADREAEHRERCARNLYICMPRCGISQSVPNSLLGTNRVWPNTHCPYCQNNGVTSFEFASHRRALVPLPRV